MFLSLLECFLEYPFCDGAQFSYRIFLNLFYDFEMTSIQSGFKIGKQEIVSWGKSRKLGGRGTMDI